MINRILLFAIILIIGNVTAFSQNIALEEGLIQYEDQLRKSIRISVDIPEDEVKSGFNDFVKEYFDTDLKGYGLLARKDEVYTELGSIPQLSEEQVKLIGLYRKNDNLTELNLLVHREDGTFITREDDPEEYANLHRVANEFLQAYVPDYYLQIVEDGQDELEDARKEVDKKREDLERNREKIADLKEQILRLENEVNEFEKELMRLEDEAEKQSEEFDALKKRQQQAMARLAKLK